MTPETRSAGPRVPRPRAAHAVQGADRRAERGGRRDPRARGAGPPQHDAQGPRPVDLKNLVFIDRSLANFRHIPCKILPHFMEIY